jgi:hypothetical protein
MNSYLETFIELSVGLGAVLAVWERELGIGNWIRRQIKNLCKQNCSERMQSSVI